ncbi:MAG: hypothetical protein RLZZ618_3175 [Pseudomonadota bacterium]|jgi:hypothetical protein
MSSVDDDELTPIRSVPSLFTLNGFGFKLYGKSDVDPETDSFMTTHYLVVLFIPLFPTGRYRVISDDGASYQFLGQGKLRMVDKVHLALFAALVMYFIMNARIK